MHVYIAFNDWLESEGASSDCACGISFRARRRTDRSIKEDDCKGTGRDGANADALTNFRIMDALRGFGTNSAMSGRSMQDGNANSSAELDFVRG
jgi:hypothetical protein